MAIYGTRGTVSVDGTAVASVFSYSYESSKSEVDITAMQDTARVYGTLLEDGSGNIEARVIPSDWGTGDGQMALYTAYANGSSVTLDLVLDSNETTGELVGWSGSSVILTSYSLPVTFDDAINVTFSYKGALAPYSG